MINNDWIEIGKLDDIPRAGARVVLTPAGRLAVFRTVDDRVYALKDQCPHRGGPLSQGMVHGHRVTCALHGLTIDLESGEAVSPDEGCAARFAIRVENATLYLSPGALAATDREDAA